MKDRFQITKPRFIRGNGRWTIVSRKHEKSEGFWIPRYSVAFGIEDSSLAFEVRTYRLKCNAIAFAKMYIEDGTIVD